MDAPLVARVNGIFNMAFLLSRGDHGGAFPLIRSSTKARSIESTLGNGRRDGSDCH